MRVWRFSRVEQQAPRRTASWRHLATVTAAGIALLVVNPMATPSGASSTATSTWIVSDLGAADFTFAAQLVTNLGGQVLEVLPAADGVEASLTLSQQLALSLIPGVVLTPNVTISLQSTPSVAHAGSDAYLSQSGATQLWAKNDQGQGINVAVLDTGVDGLADFSGRLVGGVDLTGEGNPFQDDYGHGTFVSGLIAGNGSSSNGQYEGMAPKAGLVSVKVAGANGETNLATTIEGIDWVIQHASALKIRVLNLSLGFVPFTSAYLNPLDLAVQTAWKAGIVVVVSAGNAGPFNGTIMSPGDDPYVITVGAVDDGAQSTVANDTQPAFSSVGPTNPDGLSKPDLVASGRSVVSLAAPGSSILEENPGSVIGSGNFVGSGTSFSAAITSGAVALLLQQHPGDTPDQVKAALLGTALRGPTGDPFVDGHGVLDVVAAAAAGGLNLKQNDGAILINQAMNLQLRPGDELEGGYAFTIPGSHSATSIEMVSSEVTLPVSCTQNGSVAGYVNVPLAGGPYNVPMNSTAWFPTGDQSASASYQGSAQVPDLCNGATMYAVTASLSGEMLATGTPSQSNFKFHVADLYQSGGGAWSGTQSVVPADLAAMSGNVTLGVPWLTSSWDPSNWSGLKTPSGSPSGTAWNGTAWNGTAWNGTAWNGTAWNGSAWNGTAWNGTAWNGTAWNGTAWNGTAWNGTAWNGTAWNGAAWN